MIEGNWHIYVSVNYTIIGSDDGLLPDGHQAIIWTNAGILLFEPLGMKVKQSSYFKFMKEFPITYPNRQAIGCLCKYSAKKLLFL